MIIFNLDGTLSNCEHRRHFINIPWDYCNNCYELIRYNSNDNKICDECGINPYTWEQDWKSFNEACDKDTIIEPVKTIFRSLEEHWDDLHIWSGRCESVREKTEKWLMFHGIYYKNLKMRPIGDSTPDNELKESWLDEYISSMWPKLESANKETEKKVYYRKDFIDFVFDSDLNSIEMWRRRGVFVFNCLQHDAEF